MSFVLFVLLVEVVAMQGAANKQAETFTFEISLVVPESQMQAWFDQAQPGEIVNYAEGFVCPRDAAAFKLAGAWGRAGLVDLIQRKDPDNLRRTIWQARRRASVPSSVPDRGAAGAAKRSSAEQVAELQLVRLLDLFRNAAAAGDRCPTKTEMARSVTGQTSQRALNRVVYLRKRLVADGKISVAAGTHDRAPVVTILAKGRGFGKSTRASSKAAPQITPKGEI